MTNHTAGEALSSVAPGGTSTPTVVVVVAVVVSKASGLQFMIF